MWNTHKKGVYKGTALQEEEETRFNSNTYENWN